MSQKQISPAKHWIFTWNNYPADAREILSSKSSKYKRIVCQCEIAPTTGTPHVQGYIEFKEKVRPMSVFPDITIRWKKCYSIEGGSNYCLKDDTRDPDGWELCIPRRKAPLRLMKPEQFTDWMKEIHDLILVDNDDYRTMLWFWEEVGGVGKTEFIKYMAATYGDDVVVCRTAKSSDILTCATDEARMYLFDFPRDAEVGFSPWNAIEQIKDGFVTDGKLKKTARRLIFNRPYVIIFANWPPPPPVPLSADKLRVRYIGKTVELSEVGNLNGKISAQSSGIIRRADDDVDEDLLARVGCIRPGTFVDVL